MSNPVWPIITIPEQEAAIAKQLAMKETVEESDRCAECDFFNHEFNGCNHGHNYYCGIDEEGHD